MPKIVFIEPKASNLHIYSQFKLPRLGLLILGVLMKNRGWDVEWIFEEIQKVEFAELRHVDLVGISTITATAPRAYKIAERIRQLDIPVILGGPHVTFMAEEALEYADFVIRGEGEDALMAFIDAWETNQDYSYVPNLSYKIKQKFQHNPMGPMKSDLDSIPYPDLSHLLALGRRALGHRTIPVLTSRGCPFDCAFCSVTGMFGRKYRFRSTHSIIEELRRYNDPKLHIFFYDDNFAANRKRLRTLLTAMIQEKFRFTWSTQVRIDIAQDEELVRLMRDAGCNALYIGLESVNAESLASMKKQQTLPEMSAAIRVFRRFHIHVHGMFVYGFDEDNWGTIKKTVKFAKKTRLSSTQFLILTPLPGSKIFRKMQAEKRLLFKDWTLYDAHHVVFRPAQLSLQALQKAQLLSHQKFYSWLQFAKKALRCQWGEVVITGYARKLNRTWKKRNRTFMKVIDLLTSQKQARISIDFRQKINLE